MSTATHASWTEAVRRFIDDPARFATIVTLAEDGTPCQAVVWYAVRDDGVLINSRLGRRWPANLRRDPRISLAVEDAYDYVVVRGRADVVATGDAALLDIQALARRYGADPGAFAGQARISFLVRPAVIGTHGRVAA